MAGKGLRKNILRWMPAALFALSLLLLFTASKSARFAEWYATAVYPAIVRLVGGLWGLLPFSVGEWLVYTATATILVFMARLIQARRDKPRLRRMLRRGIQVFAWAAATVFILYTLHCGINYHRLPFSQGLGLPVYPSTVEELAGLEMELIARTNFLAGQVGATGQGVTTLYADGYEISREAVRAMERLGEEYPGLAGYYPPAKPVLFSKGMSYLDITGVYFPLTVEANINVDVPEYQMPATACHELSHLRGFMREDEANFIAYLACQGSDDVRLQYSGSMLALVNVMNALYTADYQRWAEHQAMLSERVRADFVENGAYWQRHEGAISTVSTAVNDTYLKANAQVDGVKSYGRMVDLLLADYRMRAGVAGSDLFNI